MDSTKSKLIEYKEGMGKFSDKMPGFTKAYTSFTEACFQEGALPKKAKQLIALGISVHAQDEYCIIYHTKGCLDQGCTEEEILDAICVTAAFGGGPAMSQGVTLVQACIDERKQ
ncbi:MULTISPECIES: carboxymuconolactone decarboxylase family protein [Virgibacillus]|uniref:Alkylhydroperoxidase/carboxymuconolactone decarboxylase family protein n=2 Tax=Virgibacillus TaxID=84406 RepID=A0A024Q940_9BACI|nr:MULTISPECIES: carboxymuconolactone decarboxylase family protein [Virgibacillus]EQB37725.1 hypothetical protein M948_03980 [Virgibacillus sp. CM-4]MYL40461.1 carboxymuconolactone decarboxylase family protein [Virgibacillus massiliensis]GGJ58808.1 DNA-binding protein [Virgibacillus kapii]CDQ38750.1 alkylhydroperoxidase/carboxymuconolactone decarboxylase family protein [Virgibacillus massiliensis]